MSDRSLEGRIALVTGATRGIGRAAASALARAGAHVIAVGRTAGALEEVDDEIRAAGGSATLVPLDIAKGDKLDALGPSLYQRFGRLDALIANAGILGPLSPLPHITSEAWAEVLEINLTANWRLIRTLDPLLKASSAGRAVFVSSGAARARNAYWGPYSVSKAGLEALVRTYALETASTNVKANLVNPGPIRTGMRAKAFPGEDPMALKSPDDIAPLFVRLAHPDTMESGALFDFPTGEVRRSPP